MAVRSIVVTKEIINKLIDFDIDNLTIETLKGLDVLNGYKFHTFRKYELRLILNSFLKLFKETKLLENISDEQKFYFNLSCNLTEFDVITVLNYEGRSIVFNLEVKRIVGDESEKILNQVKSRVKSIIPIIYPKTHIISLGFSEDFFYGISSINDDIIEYNNLSEIDIELNDNLYVDQSIQAIDRIDSIHKIYIQAEDGTLKYYHDTKNIYNNILKEIKLGTNIIIVDGNAGTGKTVLAFKLYFKSNYNINFLMMNEKFYYALGMEKYYGKSNCITFGTDSLLSKTKEQIVVIDEAQRLNEEKLIKIIKASQSVVWIGDFTQSFSIKENVESIDDLKKIAIDLGKSTRTFKLKKSKRYTNAVERALNYLVGINTNEDSLYKLVEYEINLYLNEKQFHENLIINKEKIFTHNHYAFKAGNEEIVLNGEIFTKAERDDVSLAINNNENSYYGYTLSALSFDVKHNFVYLPDLRIDKKSDLIIPIDLDSYPSTYKSKFQNELYTLFTRGKKSLNILVTNLDVYLYFNKKLKTIKKASRIE